jgi:hypothetical protein
MEDIMKVKDIIYTRHDMFTKVKTTVKPTGTEIKYYDSETSNHLRNEIAEMEVKEWFICGAKKNECHFVIIVERNEKYEADRKKAWEDFINK